MPIFFAISLMISALLVLLSLRRKGRLLMLCLGGTLAFILLQPEEPAAPALTDATDAALYVTADRLNRRSCPDLDCGVLGQAFRGEHFVPLETRGGWVRVTEPYDAVCTDGASAYVDRGPSACTAENGIDAAGRVAEWVFADHLAATPPPAPQADGRIETLIAGSDDIHRHGAVFAEAAADLIDVGLCSPSEIQDQGGWTASTNRGPETYFVYCGGRTLAHRLYLNAERGEIFR